MTAHMRGMLDSAFGVYAEHVLATATPAEIAAARQAFYGGASCAFVVANTILDDDYPLSRMRAVLDDLRIDLRTIRDDLAREAR